MELLERIHDSLAERNEWLVLKDVMESSQDNPKTSFQAGGRVCRNRKWTLRP